MKMLSTLAALNQIENEMFSKGYVMWILFLFYRYKIDFVCKLIFIFIFSQKNMKEKIKMPTVQHYKNVCNTLIIEMIKVENIALSLFDIIYTYKID